MNRKPLLIQVFLFIILTIGVIYIFFQWVQPLKDTVEHLQFQLSEERMLNEKLSEREKQQEQTTDEIRALPVDDPLVEEIILDLHSIEGKSDSIISDMSFTENDISVNNDKNIPIYTFRIDLKLEAKNNQSLTTFLKSIEENERIYSIESVQFSNSSDNQPITASISLNTYYIKE